MRKIKFNKNFNQPGNINYIFSYNMMKLDFEKRGENIEGMEYWTEYDGYSVYPYDEDHRNYGYAKLQGWNVPPEWCIAYKYHPKHLSRRIRQIQKKRNRRNCRYLRPVRKEK